MNLNPSTEIVKAELINLKTQEKIRLSERFGRSCFFRTPFGWGDHHIQLRLDYSDLDEKGNPNLDADIWKEKNGRKQMVSKSHTSHHTRSNFNETDKQYVYDFQFDDLQLKLVVIRKIELKPPVECIPIKDKLEIKKNNKPVLQ